MSARRGVPPALEFPCTTRGLPTILRAAAEGRARFSTRPLRLRDAPGGSTSRQPSLPNLPALSYTARLLRAHDPPPVSLPQSAFDAIGARRRGGSLHGGALRIAARFLVASLLACGLRGVVRGAELPRARRMRRRAAPRREIRDHGES